jgi:hypothetical protein
MANEHVTSDGYTFSQHLSLAREWARYNGLKGTDTQALRYMKTPAAALVRMLTARNVQLPIGCEQPVGA